MRLMACVVFLVEMLGLAAGAAQAGSFPDDRAGRTVVGCNLGVGSAQARSVAETGQTRTSARYGGPSIQARFGYAVSDMFLFSGEGTLFTRQVEGINWTMGSLIGAATYYVAGSGLFIRAGMGLGIGDAQAWIGPTPASISATGPAYYGAIGYEYRVNESMAVGPQFDYNWLDVRSDFTLNYWDINLLLNWYF